ncbi:MAG: hypothetical protein KJN98_07020, partial [Pontiella sp.]|nr:hypothetical protein [Pontiella sp.]
MEDDIICSPVYLQFMNEALDTYDADHRIFCICAHTHPKFQPPRNYPHEVYLWQTFSPWGFAMWKSRWMEFISNTESELEHLKDRSVWRKFQKVRPRMATQKMYLQGKIHNDGRLNLHIFLNAQYSVFPTRNLTVNAGMDGSGTNCGLGWTYPQQILTDIPIRIAPDIQPSKKINRNLYRIHFSVVNHFIGNALHTIGLFDPLYRCYQKILCLKKPR